MKIYKGSVRLSSNQRGEWFVMYICIYIYIYIYIYRFHQNVQYVVSTLKRKQVSPMVVNDWLKFVNSLSV